MIVKIVSSKELGNCWSAIRFCGGRCDKVFTCKYPEKATCLAVPSEKAHIEEKYKQRLADVNRIYEEQLKTLDGK